MLATSSIALAGVLSWASGFRLYAALFIVGMLERFHVVTLPDKLTVLSHTPVLIATGALLVIEFLVDKVPAVDSAWDSVQTFVRVPLGALLAWGVFAHASPEVQAIAAIAGGALAAGTHVAKAGTRAAVNTSPEPFSNWGLSFSEDGVLLLGLWLAFQHPLVFLLLLALFVLLLVWLLPKIWRGLQALRRGFAKLFTRVAGREAD
ncbi:MAG TPA: DUF4126 domain-containing protein [Rhodanobacteraceae bacterium]|jgi:hypothetical protein|nr:DUF4126 domain-containing protein [Rhodanobacteraceae bacterium]